MFFRNMNVNNRDAMKYLKMLSLGMWRRLGLETDVFHCKIYYYLSVCITLIKIKYH